jgi:hypothetical protein
MPHPVGLSLAEALRTVGAAPEAHAVPRVAINIGAETVDVETPFGGGTGALQLG